MGAGTPKPKPRRFLQPDGEGPGIGVLHAAILDRLEALYSLYSCFPHAPKGQSWHVAWMHSEGIYQAKGSLPTVYHYIILLYYKVLYHISSTMLGSSASYSFNFVASEIPLYCH